jgi:hypothetical protein
MKLPWIFRNDDAHPLDVSNNFLHNLFFYVLRRPVLRPFYVFLHGHFTFSFSAPPADEVKQFAVLRFKPFFAKLGLAFIGWRSDKPIPNAFGKDWGPGGGAFDLGIKKLG